MYEHMRSRVLLSLGAAILLVAAAAPASAQEHRGALGLTGGWSQGEDVTPGLGYETRFEPGWTAGLQLERWPGSGRVGLRLSGSYAERPLTTAPTSDFNIYSADLALLLRLLPAGDQRFVAPYLAIGGGAVHYNSGDDAMVVGGGSYGGDPVIRAVAVGGVGLDLGYSPRAGLRLEFADRVMLPGVGEGPEESHGQLSHDFQLQGALQIRMGRLGGPVIVARAPRPAPVEPAPAARQEPAVRAEPAVEPAAREEVAELQTRVGEWQGRLMSLTERVDSLERELERTRSTVLARASAPVQAAGLAPARQPEPRAARPAAAAGNALYTVQIGAFVEDATASLWAERLRRRDVPVWVAHVTIKGQTYSRVRVGALTRLREARALAETLKSDYGWPVWVAPVTADDRVPRDAVAATLAFLR